MIQLGLRNGAPMKRRRTLRKESRTSRAMLTCGLLAAGGLVVGAACIRCSREKGDLMMLAEEKQVALSTIALVAGTRVALGMGAGLLLADRLSPECRRAAGWSLVAFGALTTIPLVTEVLSKDGSADQRQRSRGRWTREPQMVPVDGAMY